MCILEVPDKAAKAVSETVTQQNTDYVCSFFQQIRNIIIIIITDIIRVADIWCQRAFGDILSINVQLIKAETADCDFCS